MRLIPRNPRVRTEDPLGHGMEAGIVIVLFALGGYWLDQTINTSPLFVLVFTALGAVGLFAKLKYSYDARMDELEGQRADASSAASGEERAA